MFVLPHGLPSHPIIKLLANSTIAGTLVWLGKRIAPLSFKSGFLFSGISLISIKIAKKIDFMIQKKMKAPIIRELIYFPIAIGAPAAILSQAIPVNLKESIYLTIVAISSRGIFHLLTDKDPFL